MSKIKSLHIYLYFMATHYLLYDALVKDIDY